MVTTPASSLLFIGAGLMAFIAFRNDTTTYAVCIARGSSIHSGKIGTAIVDGSKDTCIACQTTGIGSTTTSSGHSCRCCVEAEM